MKAGKIGAVTASLIVLGLMGAALTAPMIVIEINEKSLRVLLQTHVSTFIGISDEDIARTMDNNNIHVNPSKNSYSVIDAVRELWRRGDLLPSAAIAIFSVLLPILKTFYLLIRSVFRTEARSAVATIALDRLQRFAMLDVFVTSIPVFVASKGFGYEMSFGPGFYLFIAYYAAHVAATWLILPASDVTSSRMVRQGAEA